MAPGGHFAAWARTGHGKPSSRNDDESGSQSTYDRMQPISTRFGKSPRVPVPSFRSPILSYLNCLSQSRRFFSRKWALALFERPSPARQSECAVAARDELFETRAELA
jgi:hypothetical protein